VLSAEESEQLLGYMTVEYCRLPLVVGFFADLQTVPAGEGGGYRLGDRVSYLFNPKLQTLLRAALFEQVLTARSRLSDGSPTALRRLSDGSPTALRRLSDGSLTALLTALCRLSDGSF
jgi:hypothetical protein